VQDDLTWHIYRHSSADEVYLLNEGSHGNGPKQQAYVSFARKDDWEFCSFPVHDGFYNYLPNFMESILADVLEEDAYATMHSMFRRGKGRCVHPALRNVRGPDGYLISRGYRNGESIARLNACWVDVDCYKIGLSHGQIIGQVYDLQRVGALPTPSYLKDSGRGLWICWLLGKEERAYREDVTLWSVIQNQLLRMFSSVGADAQSVDGARLSRLVGSVNTKTEDSKRATMMIFARGTDGKPIRYELADLARQFGIEHQQKPKRCKLESKPAAAIVAKERGIMGQFARWKYDEDRFWLLVETLRRTVPTGTRNAHNLIIGGILRHRHWYDNDGGIALNNAIEDAAQRLWKHHPRDDREYTLDVIRKQIHKAAFGRQTNKQKLFARSIADRLAVTTDEAEKIRDLIQTNSKGTWPPATGQEPMNRPLTRKETRERVERYLAEHDWLKGLTDSEAAARIADDTGLQVSRETVRGMRKAHQPTKPKPDLATPLLPLDENALEAVLANARRRHGIDDKS
jgi:hypothetical protein